MSRNELTTLFAHTLAITNARYVCGRAEAVLPPIMSGLDKKSAVVGVCDPPRNGLRMCSVVCRIIHRHMYRTCIDTHIMSFFVIKSTIDPDVVKAIRSTAGLDRIVYVACDANQALPNIIEYVALTFDT